MSTDTRMVAILHTDLLLSSGKLPDQAGHAFLTAWRKAHEQDPVGTKNYAESGQAEIVLVAPDHAELNRVAEKANAHGAAHALITDAARTMLAEPVVTALGLGPMPKTDCNALTRGLPLLKTRRPSDFAIGVFLIQSGSCQPRTSNPCS